MLYFLSACQVFLRPSSFFFSCVLFSLLMSLLCFNFHNRVAYAVHCLFCLYSMSFADFPSFVRISIYVVQLIRAWLSLFTCLSVCYLVCPEFRVFIFLISVFVRPSFAFSVFFILCVSPFFPFCPSSPSFLPFVFLISIRYSISSFPFLSMLHVLLFYFRFHHFYLSFLLFVSHSTCMSTSHFHCLLHSTSLISPLF